MGKTDLSRVSLYSVRVTSVKASTVSTHPSCCSVDSATDEALLSPNRQGVDVGCTWNALCWRVLDFVESVNVGLYFMAAGAAEAARLGALGVCRAGCVEALIGLTACVVPAL